MKIERASFLQALKSAAPALSTKPLMPQFMKFWFTGDLLRATDGNLGIEVPLKTEFEGGLPGQVLLGFMSSLSGKDIDCKQKDDELIFRCGSATVKLKLDELENAVWQFGSVEDDNNGAFQLDDWREALLFTMISTTNASALPEREGITLTPVGKALLQLYATDGQTISWAKMQKPKDWPEDSLVVHANFVREALKLLPEGGTFAVRDDACIAYSEAGMSIHHRYVDVQEPTDFASAIARYRGNSPLVSIPEGFGDALARAELLKDDKDGIVAELRFYPEAMRISARSTYGDLKEDLYFEGEHPEVSARFVPSAIIRGLDGRDSFAVLGRTAVFTGPENFMYLVASSAAGGKE